MKKAFILCAAFMLFTANTAFSTPVPESSTNIAGTIAPASMQNLRFTRNWKKPDMPRFDFDNDDKGRHERKKYSFIPSWKPSWLPTRTKQYWYKKYKESFRKHPRFNKRRCERNPSPVPEPATMLLFGAGLVGLTIIRRKKSNQK